MEQDEVVRILKALNTEGVEDAIVGAIALSVHGLTRATQAIDLFVTIVPDNIARLKRALNSVFDDPSIEEISAEDLAGEYPAVRYVPPAGDFVIDIIGRLGDAVRWEDLEVVDGVFEEARIRVVSPRSLYEMKKGTLRPKDKLDAELLRRRFKFEDD